MKKILSFMVLLLAGAVSVQSQVLPNNHMEIWQHYSSGFLAPVSLQKPEGWYGGDSIIAFLGGLYYTEGTFQSQLLRSDDRNEGSYAAKMVTRRQDSLGLIPGMMANGRFETMWSPDMPYPYFFSFLSFAPGTLTPVTEKINTVTAWVKYEGQGGDEGSLTVVAGKESPDGFEAIGYGKVMITNAAYQEVTVAIDYSFFPDSDPAAVPDRIAILFSSSDLEMPYNQSAIHEGSSLWVDGVSMQAGLTAIAVAGNTEPDIVLFPNPVSDCLHYMLPQLHAGGNYTLSVFDVAGKLVQQKKLPSCEQGTIDLSACSPGVYQCVLANNELRSYRPVPLIVR